MRKAAYTSQITTVDTFVDPDVMHLILIDCKMIGIKHYLREYQINICLAYYPPYHSKYNPIERCWGILEQHWNGSLFDSVDAVIQFARTMTWKGNFPVVKLVTTSYRTGVKLTKEAMEMLEAHLQRMPTLEKWFVVIKCSTSDWDN